MGSRRKFRVGGGGGGSKSKKSHSYMYMEKGPPHGENGPHKEKIAPPIDNKAPLPHIDIFF